MMIAKVLRAEREERERRSKIQALVEDFDAKTRVRTNLQIKDGGNPCSSYKKVKLAMPMNGVHRYAGRQGLYEDIHRFLRQRGWGELDHERGDKWHNTGGDVCTIRHHRRKNPSRQACNKSVS